MGSSQRAQNARREPYAGVGREQRRKTIQQAVEITPAVVKGNATSRLAEKAGPKTINNEVLLLRICGGQGDLIRARLSREKAMKLGLPPSPGRAYTADEKARMLAEAAKLRSKNMYPALVLDLNCGLRD